MPAPVLKSFAQRLYDSVAPLAYADSSNGYALAYYCAALGQMFQIVEDYSRDQVVGSKLAPGWSQLLDVNRCPPEALAWLGQFVGVPPLVGLTDAAQRARILNVGGFNRGTVASMTAAAQQYLTGAKSVVIRERDGTACPALPAYGLTIITRESETPVEEWPTTNLFTNGGFETDATSGGWSAWGDTGITLVRSTAQAKFGSASGLVTTTATGGTDGCFCHMNGMVPGKVLTFSIYVRPTVAVNMQLQTHMYTLGGVIVGTPPSTGPVACPAGQWTRLSITVTVSATVENIYFITCLYGGPVPTTFYIDGAQLEEHTAATPYVETNGATASRAAGQANMLNALNSQKPAGIIMNYQVVTGEDYSQLLANHPLYSNVFADFLTYQGVATGVPGT